MAFLPGINSNKIKTYDGQIEVTSKANTWSGFSGGITRTSTCFASHPNRETEKGDYQKFSAALAIRFGEQHLQQFFQAPLKTRKHKAG